MQRWEMVILALALFISGCAPPGPRALLKGKKLLEHGDTAGAVEQLKSATALLATNAAAWNFYGVALQRAGDAAGAADAYQNALKFDRDLMEAHYNLGCLRLEQNKPDAARAEFTAYTLRRNNVPEGWLKLGAAQLRLGDTPSAERSFSTAFYLNTNNAEALNGLGLASVRRGQPQDAARFFAAAVRFHPGYAPAILNLATVSQQYLHDDQAALDNYRKYLALTPRPPDWDAVNALVNNSGRTTLLAMATSPAPPAAKETKPPVPTPPAKEIKPAATAGGAAHPVSPPKIQQNARNNPPAQTVQVQTEPAIVMEPAAQAQPANPVRVTASPRALQNNTYAQTGVTPLPPGNSAPAEIVAPKPVKIVPPAPPSFPRYLYLSPRKPKAGDRKAATQAFTAAQHSEQQAGLTEAMDSYRKAAELDPGWFEAQYNYSVLALRVRDYSHALPACEMALAIQPDSTDARYIFALALKAAGYMTDAANELRKVVAAKPDDARTHLALGNLYAQQLRDPAQARREYLRVLALDPRNPAAGDIQFWLSANPP